jgi:hypothetical protein
MRRSQQVTLALALCLATAMALGACNGTTVTVSAPTPVPSATHAASPTATPVPTCAQLVSGAGSASAGSSFTDVTFPSGSISTTPALHLSGTGLWTIYLLNACAPNTTAAAVRSFYSSQLTAQGWTYAPTLPFDGGYQQACGDAYCWGKDAAPRYVGLEVPTDHPGGSVTFTLRLFVPPSIPGCLNNGPFSPPYQSFYPQYSSLPLPPLTLFGPGDGSGGLTSNTMCSAGTMDAVNSFFTNELTKHGWHQGSFTPPSGQPACGGPSPFKGWISPDGKHVAAWTATGGSAAANGWFLQYCV